jgi:hypothetical protein
VDFFDAALKEKYKQYFVSDPLAFGKDAIDWTAFPQMLKNLYNTDTDKVGRPNFPIITMVNIMFACFAYNVHTLKIIN